MHTSTWSCNNGILGKDNASPVMAQSITGFVFNFYFTRRRHVTLINVHASTQCTLLMILETNKVSSDRWFIIQFLCLHKFLAFQLINLNCILSHFLICYFSHVHVCRPNVGWRSWSGKTIQWHIKTQIFY